MSDCPALPYIPPLSQSVSQRVHDKPRYTAVFKSKNTLNNCQAHPEVQQKYYSLCGKSSINLPGLPNLKLSIYLFQNQFKNYYQGKNPHSELEIFGQKKNFPVIYFHETTKQVGTSKNHYQRNMLGNMITFAKSIYLYHTPNLIYAQKSTTRDGQGGREYTLVVYQFKAEKQNIRQFFCDGGSD